MGMPDREAAIARLLRIADRERAWMEEIGLPDASSIGAFLRDVAEMLREQEPVKPKRVLGAPLDWYQCGVCGADMLDTGDEYRPKYCPQCGKAVKWDAGN